VVRRLAALLPQPFVAWLNEVQHKHARLGRFLRAVGDRIAVGEGTIRRGPAAGIRIDATGRMPGYILGTADYEEQLWLADHLGPGDTFYDIGANIGFFTLLGRKLVGASGAVVAFEPLPANVEQLRRNVALNQFRNVKVVATAVSGAEGVGVFSVGGDARNTGKLVAHNSQGRSIRVPMATIDATVKKDRLAPPTVMKIDVEGEEIEVLRGALETISGYRPLLLIEVHWLGKAFIEFVDDALVPLGYTTRTMSGEGVPREPVRFHAVIAPRSVRGRIDAR
jgi:FkbM family methyltransferase